MNSSVSVLNDSIIVSYCMMMVVGERYRKASTALLDILYVENVLIQKNKSTSSACNLASSASASAFSLAWASSSACSSACFSLRASSYEHYKNYVVGNKYSDFHSSMYSMMKFSSNLSCKLLEVLFTVEKLFIQILHVSMYLSWSSVLFFTVQLDQ